MQHPKNISIADFGYHLPDKSIASFPADQRDLSRLLLWNKGTITEDVFRNIPSHLSPGSLMVLNDTKVVEARINFYKATGARIEIFCLEPGDEYPDITSALSQHGKVIWKCMVGRASSWLHQTTLSKELQGGIQLHAFIVEKKSDHFLVQLSWLPENLSFAEILHLAGLTPLPPYIKRLPQPSDLARYQTVYAHQPGSVAAPTAGLHFTDEVMNQLSARGVATCYVTLHVSAGTFKPVKSERMSDHEMHAEFIEIKRSLIDQLLSYRQQSIVAVGTTSLRTLESIYWIGEKIFSNPQITQQDLHLSQWYPYDTGTDIPVTTALRSILQWMDNHSTNSIITRTSLLIAPPYQFKVVDVLVTNFHQPRSTLLLLVAAFIGPEWKSVYAYALENNFRFLSYGDCCLLFRQ